MYSLTPTNSPPFQCWKSDGPGEPEMPKRRPAVRRFSTKPEDLEPPVDPASPELPAAAESRPDRLSDRQLNIVDSPTFAPTVGAVLDTFSSHLDGANPFRLPGLSVDAGVLGPFWLAAASMAGLSHLHKGRTGQDSYSFALANGGSHVTIAVADGLGSRPAYSQIGATLLTRAVCNALASVSYEELTESDSDELERCVSDANDEVRSIRDIAFTNLSDSDLAATLAFAVIPVDVSTGPAVAARIGDCAGFTMVGGQYDNIFPKDDTALNVVDACLPSSRPTHGLRVELMDLVGKDCFVLTTDGLAEDIFGSPKVREWLAESWLVRCGPARMLDTLRYRRQGSQDDRTCVVLWLAPLVEAGTYDHEELAPEPWPQSPFAARWNSNEGDVSPPGPAE